MTDTAVKAYFFLWQGAAFIIRAGDQAAGPAFFASKCQRFAHMCILHKNGLVTLYSFRNRQQSFLVLYSNHRKGDTRCTDKYKIKSLNIKLCGINFDRENTRFCRSHIEVRN